MYFPLEDILNDTILGMPKDNTDNWNDIIDAFIKNNKSEE